MTLLIQDILHNDDYIKTIRLMNILFFYEVIR